MCSPQAELDINAVRDLFARLWAARVTGIERIGGGRNSQVYQVGVDGPGPRRYALKVYFRHPADKRDRLATEYNSYAYLWESGFREIPQPLAMDSTRGWAVYQFIEGVKLGPGQATRDEVLEAVDFLGRLRELSRCEGSRKLGVASEAFFAPELIVQHVRQRLGRLQQAAKDNPVPNDAEKALDVFLAGEFVPFLEETAQWSQATVESGGQSFGEELDWSRRTLSPSDFGFHNALRQADGRMIFLDFEYFGWDDPAKMIADFLLHPAMELSSALKRVFAANVLGRFGDWPGLAVRVRSVYPLFGLKWCLILLNEFLPESYLRRQFALAPADREGLQAQQLAKARRMLDQIRNEYQHFPYCD